ncbi:MAG TPA: nitrilotriacetate monooxygenase [Alphaproteobacteria bacterium]|nr:nitrilotriacetate monooxygenase [Alphaproteobacteria bacterium]
MPDSGVSAQNLRTAMGTFLTGVTIVTVRGANAEPYGLTVSSFNSVSLDPPLILWSLDNRHEKAQLFREAGGFTVNIMPTGSEALIQKFALSDTERFNGTDWHWGPSGQPVLNTALTSLECSLWAEYPGGDHAIFVGKVTAINTRDGQPAAYFKGQISAFGP